MGQINLLEFKEALSIIDDKTNSFVTVYFVNSAIFPSSMSLKSVKNIIIKQQISHLYS